MTSPPKTGHRSILRSVGLTFAGQGVLVLLGVGASVLSARVLGVAGKGQFNTALLAAAILGLLVEFGLRTAAVRAVAAGRATWKEVVTTLLAVYGIVSLLLVPAASLLLHHYHQRLAPGIPLEALYLALATIPLGLISTTLTGALAGEQRLPEISTAQIAERVTAMLGFVGIAWLLRFGVTGALVAQLTGVGIGLLVATRYLAGIPGGRARIRWDLLPEFFRFGRAVYASNLAMSLNYRLDALLVFAFLGDGTAGLYAIAVSMAELPQQVPQSMAAVLFPRASSGSAQIGVHAARLARVTVLVITLACLALAALGYPLILWLPGREYLPAYPALLLLLPGMVCIGLYKIIAADLTGRGYPQYATASAWVALGITVLLDLLLIPRMGIRGAALVSSVAYGIGAVLLLTFYRRITGIGVRELVSVRPDELREIGQRIWGAVRRRGKVAC